jgi:hypothetical protein
MDSRTLHGLQSAPHDPQKRDLRGTGVLQDGQIPVALLFGLK